MAQCGPQPTPRVFHLPCLPRQIKGLSNWATAQSQRAGGEGVLEGHHPRLIMTLIRCMRLSFTGSAPVADGDAQYAQVAGAGEAPVYIWSASIECVVVVVVGATVCVCCETYRWHRKVLRY